MRFLDDLAKQHRFTLLYAALILIATIPYNLVFPDYSACNSGGLPHFLLYSTAPFNIGCEASLMQLGTKGGNDNFLNNFALALLPLALVEFFVRKEDPRYMRNIFAAAIMAAYFASMVFLWVANGKQVGTSIVALSMLLYLIGFSIKAAWQAMPNFWKALPMVFLAVIEIFGVYGIYSLQNAAGHALGGFFFVLFFGMMKIKPDWWESYKQMLQPRK